jgi:hypothetical protein
MLRHQARYLPQPACMLSPLGRGRNGPRKPDIPMTAAEETACWETAGQIRRERPGWVVIWVARKGQYQARPLFRAPRDTVAAAATPEGLTAQMDAVQQAARPRPLRTQHHPQPSATTR